MGFSMNFIAMNKFSTNLLQKAIEYGRDIKKI